MTEGPSRASAYYAEDISSFLAEGPGAVLGKLAAADGGSIDGAQIEAWQIEIELLRKLVVVSRAFLHFVRRLGLAARSFNVEYRNTRLTPAPPQPPIAALLFASGKRNHKTKTDPKSLLPLRPPNSANRTDPNPPPRVPSLDTASSSEIGRRGVNAESLNSPIQR